MAALYIDDLFHSPLLKMLDNLLVIGMSCAYMLQCMYCVCVYVYLSIRLSIGICYEYLSL